MCAVSFYQLLDVVIFPFFGWFRATKTSKDTHTVLATVWGLEILLAQIRSWKPQWFTFLHFTEHVIFESFKLTENERAAGTTKLWIVEPIRPRHVYDGCQTVHLFSSDLCRYWTLGILIKEIHIAHHMTHILLIAHSSVLTLNYSFHLVTRKPHHIRKGISLRRVPQISSLLFSSTGTSTILILLLQALFIHLLFQQPPLILILLRQLRQRSFFLHLIRSCLPRSYTGRLRGLPWIIWCICRRGCRGCVGSSCYTLALGYFGCWARLLRWSTLLKYFFLLIIQQAFLIDNVNIILHAFMLR